MPVERTLGGTSLIDVLDRVLDKGIVIDAWVRVSLVGIDLITVEARIVVASIDTYLKYSEAVGQVAPVSKPAGPGGRAARASEAVLAENAVPAGAARRSGRATPRRRRARRGRAAGRGVARWPRPGARRRADAAAAVARGGPPSGGAGSGLAEFLLTCDDLEECARRSLEWLAEYAGAPRGLCLAMDVRAQPPRP